VRKKLGEKLKEKRERRRESYNIAFGVMKISRTGRALPLCLGNSHTSKRRLYKKESWLVICSAVRLAGSPIVSVNAPLNCNV